MQGTSYKSAWRRRQVRTGSWDAGQHGHASRGRWHIQRLLPCSLGFPLENIVPVTVPSGQLLARRLRCRQKSLLSSRTSSRLVYGRTCALDQFQRGPFLWLEKPQTASLLTTSGRLCPVTFDETIDHQWYRPAQPSSFAPSRILSSVICVTLLRSRCLGLTSADDVSFSGG